jgi:hypothetical protein
MRARLSLAVLIPLLLLRSAATAEAVGKKPDVEFLLGFLAGNYRLIGQKPDSGAAYSGRLTLQRRGRAFHVIRTIDRATAEGTASIETTSEGIAVLRMRFPFDGVEHEATYLWQSDLDNYPRLAGYVYRLKRATKSPGIEALFHIPPTPAK